MTFRAPAAQTPAGRRQNVCIWRRRTVFCGNVVECAAGAVLQSPRARESMPRKAIPCQANNRDLFVHSRSIVLKSFKKKICLVGLVKRRKEMLIRDSLAMIRQ